ncbi:putative dehydrogenase [Melghirimyces profundicolus]|uniref:Putative dehydrogenase n=1 Tax=Melghirimyces profundicolus TaxID=1242148 RepID=A0A2T6C8B6_9BACL|nr:Gfo/Idh/MocA family oxidoreductase [Melghirimyces profundicolus]PTX64552.1 putative dehydrogenase [Melghirimyces profundicolus]
MTKPLRVGIMGAGGIARGAHLPNYKKMGDRVQVVAVADVIEEKAEECARIHSIPHFFSSLEEMLDQVELDAVSVCTPNKFHAPATIAALKAGCHVLCEKPPAMTSEEAEEMARTAKRQGKILTYGFHYRHSPEVETLKRFVDAGELGEIYASRVYAVRRRGIPGWGVFTNKELQGGGPLIDIGVHMLDSALYLMGYPEPELVMGAAYQKIGNRKGVGLMGEWDWKNYSVEDMARGMIRFKDGSSLMLETAFAANVEKDDTMQVTLMGDRGGADVFPLKIYQEKHDTLLDITPAYLPKKNYHEVEIERFVHSCLGLTSPLSTPEQGVILQRLIEAIYQSAETGEAVKL